MLRQQRKSVVRGSADMERTRKPKPPSSPPSVSHTIKSDSAKTKPKLEIDPAVTTHDACAPEQVSPKQQGQIQPHAQHPQFQPREFNARELDYVVTAITTGRQLERLADAVAEAVMTKLSRYQRLELDAQFIADAVMKRLDEERQVSRIVLELIRDGLEPEAPPEKPKPATEAAAGSVKHRKRSKK